MKVLFKKLNENAVMPTYGSPFSAGADLYSAEEELIIPAGETALIGTGLSMEIPEGYGGFIYARSGLATKKGLIFLIVNPRHSLRQNQDCFVPLKERKGFGNHSRFTAECFCCLRNIPIITHLCLSILGGGPCL